MNYFLIGFISKKDFHIAQIKQQQKQQKRSQTFNICVDVWNGEICQPINCKDGSNCVNIRTSINKGKGFTNDMNLLRCYFTSVVFIFIYSITKQG